MSEKTHKFTSGDGTERTYIMVLEEERCPDCNPHGMRKNGVFGVIAHTEGYSSWECLNCAKEVVQDPNEVEFKYPKIVEAAVIHKTKGVF